MRLLFSVYALIFLAELPDKTFFSALLLAARRHHVAVFAGAAAAFALQCAIAVLLGGVLSLLPPALVHYGAAALFLGMAAKLAFFEGEEEPEAGDAEAGASRFWRDAREAFSLIFVAEWGDLTQLSTAAFAAKYGRPVVVFAGSWLALCTVSALAVTAGNRLKHWLRPDLLRRAAAAAFALVGATILWQALRG